MADTNKLNKEIIGEVLIIIGGIILAETIIKLFIEFSKEPLIQWVDLPLMAILFVVFGVNLRGNHTLGSCKRFIFLGIILAVVLHILYFAKVISFNLFSSLSILSILFAVILYLCGIFRKNKKNEKKIR
jgi:hypothetical protein